MKEQIGKKSVARPSDAEAVRVMAKKMADDMVAEMRRAQEMPVPMDEK